jgi:hypothetical protein
MMVILWVFPMTLDQMHLSVSVRPFGAEYSLTCPIAAGPGSAYRSLDSIRAIKQSGNITSVTSDPIVTMFGYSNGGTVIAWVSYLILL